MFDAMKSHLQSELQKIRDAGLWKDERILASSQGPMVTLADGATMLMRSVGSLVGARLATASCILQAAR